MQLFLPMSLRGGFLLSLPPLSGLGFDLSPAGPEKPHEWRLPGKQK